MLALSAERSLGAIPYFVPVEHASVARAQLGAGPLLVPELAYVLDTDAERARTTAREYARLYLGMSNYTNNLLALGSTGEDLAGDGSDRLIDAVIPHGTAGEIAAVVRAHAATPVPTTSPCRRSASPASRARAGARSPKRCCGSYRAVSGSGPQCCAASEARLQASRPAMSMAS